MKTKANPLFIDANAIPNLDGFDPSELDELRAQFKQAQETLRLLACYAEAKANGMRSRLSGKIPLALKFEQAADWVYKQLPRDVRW